MEDLVFYYSQGHEAHNKTDHCEHPERVEVIRRAFEQVGWWEAYPHLAPIPLFREFLEKVHTPAYLHILQDACEQGSALDEDTYTTPASWQLALNTAGGAAAIARKVWSGESKRGIALTRPPGHHATASCGMGYCLINNISVAAEYLLNQPDIYSPKAQKLAIVDLDLHHGNGTQDIFYQRSDVLFISTHQHSIYPWTGSLEETGDGPGEGCTANFPLPPGTGDEGFKVVMDELIVPLLDRYQPQILLIDVGCDPHWRDSHGELMLSAKGYGDLIQRLVKWADQYCAGRIALFLEGGYDLEAGAACLIASTAALIGQPYQDPLGPSPQHESKSWQVMVQAAKDLWKL